VGEVDAVTATADTMTTTIPIGVIFILGGDTRARELDEQVIGMELVASTSILSAWDDVALCGSLSLGRYLWYRRPLPLRLRTHCGILIEPYTRSHKKPLRFY